MKGKVLVFGGTTEGRILSEYLRKYEIPHEVSVATEYGKEILLESGEDNLLVGRKNCDEIADIIRTEGFSFVVDATHPFATAVSKEIKAACEIADAEYVRLKRDTGKKHSGSDNVTYVDTLKEATDELNKIEGNILLLTGSKDLQEIAGSFTDVSRLFVRVLPNAESIEKCVHAGLSGRQIIAMQGPFSKEMNIATIKEIGAVAVLTKESGKTGGLDEKIDAALECGIKAFVLSNPESRDLESCGCSLGEVLQLIMQHIGKEITVEREITLAGIGPGGEEFRTMELQKAIERADIIFGAKAVLKNIDSSVICIPEYQGEKIYDYLEQNESFMNPLVLFSGDISLCSGAKKATRFFEDKGYKVKRISGISSVTVFAERLGLSLENVRLVSAHGRECNVMRHVMHNSEVIILPSNAEHAEQICTKIKESVFGQNEPFYDANEFEKVASRQSDFTDDFRIVAGCDLGTEDEKILDITCSDASEQNISGKCLIYVRNPKAFKMSVLRTLSDDEIIRGKTPMTKEEIRALSMRKLRLCPDCVFYDIGAGTGSISLEAALCAPDIKVFSIEKNDEACDLLRRNKEKLNAGNIEIIHGTAPDVLADLPAPSHVFIGGSSGNIREILRTVFNKNEKASVVINTVTAETFAKVMESVKDYPEIEPDIIQVSVTRFKKAGRYHLADALNPVYIITIRKGGQDGED